MAATDVCLHLHFHCQRRLPLLFQYHESFLELLNALIEFPVVVSWMKACLSVVMLGSTNMSGALVTSSSSFTVVKVLTKVNSSLKLCFPTAVVREFVDVILVLAVFLDVEECLYRVEYLSFYLPS